LFQRGSLEESCACYETATRIDADFVEAFNNLAVALCRLGRPESAEANYKQALRLVPDSAEILLNLATLLGELGRHREGCKIVSEVLDRRPNLMRARSLLTEFRTNLKSSRRGRSKSERSDC
jgi:tetratricopeptide (TPR) repeat protein